jgi:hypothetical protein
VPNPPELEEVLMGIRVYPIGITGSIAALVEVMDGRYVNQRENSRAALRLELRTDHQSIYDFGKSLCWLAKGNSDAVARLNAITF